MQTYGAPGWATVRLPWRAGPAAAASEGPAVVSITRTQVRRFRDLPEISVRGLAMRRRWPMLPGAVGMAIGLAWWRRQTFSVSVWQSEEDARRFLRTPTHMAAVRKYRPSSPVAGA